MVFRILLMAEAARRLDDQVEAEITASCRVFVSCEMLRSHSL
jgi:hypothetical protein